MEKTSLSGNKQETITLTGILPAIRQLPPADKLRLIRILAEELENKGKMFPLEPGKTYSLPTPYNTFGAAEILVNALEASEVGE